MVEIGGRRFCGTFSKFFSNMVLTSLLFAVAIKVMLSKNILLLLPSYERVTFNMRTNSMQVHRRRPNPGDNAC